MDAPSFETLTEYQQELETLFNKNQLVPRIRAEFEVNPEFSEHMTQQGIPVDFGMDLLVQMVLHKRTNIATIVGCLFLHLKDAQATADMLLVCLQAGLVNWSPDLRVFIVKFNISAAVQTDLDRFQFPLPMLVEPQTIETNRSCGYLNEQHSSSVILRNNHHNKDVCLDHLNRANQVKLRLNHDVVKMIQNTWKSLDKAKEGETQEDFGKRKRAFEKYDHTSRAVISLLKECSDSFYLTHKYDKRGRTYSMGYHVNYQGNDWNKAVIEFDAQELVT